MTHNPYTSPTPDWQHTPDWQPPHHTSQLPPHEQSHNPYGQSANPYSPSSDNVYLSTPQRPAREMHRSIYDRWLGGVCGGLAEYMGWSPTLVRLLFVLSILIPGPQVIYYIAAWIIVPQQGEDPLRKFEL